MGNQQERLAYLAGIIDGEGHVGMVVAREKKVVGGIQLKPIIQVQMKSPGTISYLGDLSHELNLPCYVYHWKYEKSRWSVLGLGRVEKWLPLLLPYLFTKRRQAELLAEFITSRKAWEYGKGLTDRELEIFEILKLLNGRGESSETVRRTALERR